MKLYVASSALIIMNIADFLSPRVSSSRSSPERRFATSGIARNDKRTPAEIRILFNVLPVPF